MRVGVMYFCFTQQREQLDHSWIPSRSSNLMVFSSVMMSCFSIFTEELFFVVLPNNDAMQQSFTLLLSTFAVEYTACICLLLPGKNP